jgi:hypothetical protein
MWVGTHCFFKITSLNSGIATYSIQAFLVYMLNYFEMITTTLILRISMFNVVYGLKFLDVSSYTHSTYSTLYTEIILSG